MDSATASGSTSRRAFAASKLLNRTQNKKKTNEENVVGTNAQKVMFDRVQRYSLKIRLKDWKFFVNFFLFKSIKPFSFRPFKA